jgi:hypothetical protein
MGGEEGISDCIFLYPVIFELKLVKLRMEVLLTPWRRIP